MKRKRIAADRSLWFRAEEGLAVSIERLAEQHHRSMSMTIRLLVKEAIRAREDDPKRLLEQ